MQEISFRLFKSQFHHGKVFRSLGVWQSGDAGIPSEISTFSVHFVPYIQVSIFGSGEPNYFILQGKYPPHHQGKLIDPPSTNQIPHFSTFSLLSLHKTPFSSKQFLSLQIPKNCLNVFSNRLISQLKVCQWSLYRLPRLISRINFSFILQYWCFIECIILTCFTAFWHWFALLGIFRFLFRLLAQSSSSSHYWKLAIIQPLQPDQGLDPFCKR